jgi:Zn-dependent protease
MVKCDKCGEEVYMPFRCNYCGGYYCSRHRLPEFHECTGIQRGQGSVNLGGSTGYRSSGPSYYTPRRRYSFTSLFRFSERELRDLGISLLLISALPMSMPGFFRFRPVIMFGIVAIFAAAFLLHELAHKFAAQRYGYWAEFRLNTMGLLITLFSFISPLKLVAPGAVMIAGLMYGDDYGKISLSGPVTNIAQALVFLAAGVLFPSGLMAALSYLGIMINSSLALFNLIPFGMFDGAKIMRWDWRIWLVATAVALGLYLYPSIL